MADPFADLTDEQVAAITAEVNWWRGLGDFHDLDDVAREFGIDLDGHDA